MSERLVVALQYALPKRLLTQFAGKLAGLEGGAATTAVVRWFAKRYGVNLAEAVNPEHGLGYMVELARTHHKASWSFAGLFVIGGIGLITDAAIRLFWNVAFRWKEKAA